MENFHAHPAGASMYPSWGDLVALSTWYNRGHINAGNYIYGVISEFGIMVLTVAHEGSFRNFAETVVMEDRGFIKEKYEQFYNSTNGSVENIICDFISFLNGTRSGLQILYKPNEAFGKPEWSGQWKSVEVESGSRSLSSNCNQ